jgi:hypothetical protein
MKSLMKIFTPKKCSKQPVLCYCDDCYNMEKKETSSDSDSESDEFDSNSESNLTIDIYMEREGSKKPKIHALVIPKDLKSHSNFYFQPFL